MMVVGAGLTGIETAVELAELGRTVMLVCGGAVGPVPLECSSVRCPVRGPSG